MDIRLADQGDLEVGSAVRASVAFGTLHSRRSGALEVVRVQVAQGGVPTSGVVPALDELEDGHAYLGRGLERPPFDARAWPQRGLLEWSRSWPPPGPLLGDSVEPAADRPSAPDRVSRR